MAAVVAGKPAAAIPDSVRDASEATGWMGVDNRFVSACQAHRGRRWYAVQTQPRREHFAGANLERQGFPAFIPCIRKTVRHARKARIVLAPLFPCYLFVALDLQRDRWRSVNGTLGVARLVSDGTAPIPAPGGLVEELMEMTERLGAVTFDRSLEPGQRVRFLTGPFADSIGRLLSLDDTGRAQVLMELMGAERSVAVEAAGLAPEPG